MKRLVQEKRLPESQACLALLVHRCKSWAFRFTLDRYVQLLNSVPSLRAGGLENGVVLGSSAARSSEINIGSRRSPSYTGGASGMLLAVFRKTAAISGMQQWCTAASITITSNRMQ